MPWSSPSSSPPLPSLLLKLMSWCCGCWQRGWAPSMEVGGMDGLLPNGCWHRPCALWLGRAPSGGDYSHTHLVQAPMGGVRLGVGTKGRVMERADQRRRRRQWSRGGEEEVGDDVFGEERVKIFFGACTREAAGDEVFYGAFKWWIPPSACHYLPMQRGSPRESLKGCDTPCI
jgi:hypothetical protein